MKANKFNLIWSVLLCTTVIFSQKQTKKIDESFKVNRNVLVEITTRHSDVKVVTWNKNTVSIQGVWEVEGMTKEEADKYFNGWNFEALGNKNKVVITSKSSNNYDEHYDVFDDMDFDFDMESVAHIGEMFHGDYFSNLPSMPPLPTVTPLPPMAPMPPLPEAFVGHLKQIEFDYDAYEKDKEGYLEKFQKRQEKWEKDFEEKIEPQMKAYEKQIEEWQNKMKPQMKAHEKIMEARTEINEKRIEARIKANEKRMEARMKVMDAKMKKEYAQKMKEKEAKMSKYKIRKNLLIKVPVGATLKVDARYGKITLPDNMKTTN